mgnify:CR=1 FL=1
MANTTGSAKVTAVVSVLIIISVVSRNEYDADESDIWIYHNIKAYNFSDGGMMSKIYGYVRVSSKDQYEDRQIIALNEMGVPKENIFIDKKSGKDFERKAYRKSNKVIEKFKRSL